MKCIKCGSDRYQNNGICRRKDYFRKQYKCSHCGYQWRGANIPYDHGTRTAKILLLDIETAPMHGTFWELGKQYVGMEQIEKDWFILGWSAKWLFSNETMSEFVSSKESIERDDKRILTELWKIINDSSIIIGHNIKGFDIPKITTRFIFHHILPPKPFQMIDTLAAVKPLSFSSNKLKYVTMYLNLKSKLKTDLQLWKDCEAGDEKSLRYMKKYCIGDTLALEEAFVELRPYIKTGVNMALHNHSAVKCCSMCGSPMLTPKGYYYTTVSRFTSYQCDDCGAYSRERSSDLSLSERRNLLSPVAR